MLALPVVGGLESLAGAVIGGAFLATAQPLVNLFHIRLFLASAVALILVASSRYDGVIGLARSVLATVRQAVVAGEAVRYGSFLPEAPAAANGRAHGRVRVTGRVPRGSVIRLRVQSPGGSR